MQNVDIRNISMGELLYFVKVVEYNSFTRASEHFHLTQSTISKKVASLEQQLDLQLFIRKNKEITLTEAGEYLYERWKELPYMLEKDIQTAHTLKRGFENTLTIAMLDSFRSEIFLEPMLEFLNQTQPMLRLNVEYGGFRKVQELMLKGQADVVFTNYFALKGKDCGSLRWKRYGSCPSQVCMRWDHPLTKKELVQPEDLKDSRFVCVAPHIMPEYVEMIKEIGNLGGFEPSISKYTYSAAGMAMNLIQDDEVVICDKYYREYLNPRFCFRPLAQMDSGYVMIYDSVNTKKEIIALIGQLDDFLLSKLNPAD